MKFKSQHISLYLTFLVSLTFLLLNRYTPLYINNMIVHFTVLFTAASSFVLIIGIQQFGLKEWKSILITLLLLFVMCFAKAFLTWGGDWKTQTVLYEDKNNQDNTVDFQMRGDRFAFGYKRRIIQRERIMPFLDNINDADTTKLDRQKWQRVDKEINEMNFPGDYVDFPSYQKEQP